jgi:hypothetical protein
MTRIDCLSARIRELEDIIGYVTLPNGTRFKPCGSGLRLMRLAIRFKRDHHADPKLSNFSEKDQEQWRGFAMWLSPPGELGKMVLNMARELVDRSDRHERSDEISRA